MRNNLILTFGLIALSVFFSGCKVTRDYQRPELALPAVYRAQVSADTATAADLPWKTFFPDTNLQRLIAEGITHNYDLQLALKRMEIAGEQLSQARLLPLPSVDLQLTGQYNRPSSNSLNGVSISNFLGTKHLENYLLSVTPSWEADIWGKIRRRQEAAQAAYLQTFEASKAIQTRLMADIAKGFFNLLMLDKQLEVARDNLKLSEQTLRLTRLLQASGETTSLSVQQAEALQESIRLLIPQLEQDIVIQENALQLLTGRPPAPVARRTVLQDIGTGDSLNTGIPAALVARRPDVRSAEMAVVQANALLGVAKADMYPSLKITAGGGIESFRASNWFSIPGSLFGIVAGSIAQPLFARGELKTNYKIAGIRREEAVLAFRQTVLNAIGEVSANLAQAQKWQQQEQIARNQATILRKAVANAQLLFQSDMANYLEVITAQRNALQAELDLTFIHSQALMTRVDLYRSLGGGWKE